MAEPTPDILTLHAKLQPDKLALIEDRPGREGVLGWTYAELEARSNRLAHVLADAGMGPGQKLLWCGHNSPDVVVVIHAARKVGATAVPLNYRLTPEEAAYVVDNSDAALACIDAEYAPLFEKIRAGTPKLRRVLVYDGEPGADMEAMGALVEAAPDAPLSTPEVEEAAATMIYTSGTTGKPKGALRRGGGDPEQTRALVAEFGYRPDDVFLTTGPIYHSGPGGFMGIAFALGQTVVVQRKFDAEDWLRLVDAYQVSSTFSAPTPIRMVTQLPEEVKSRYSTASMKRFVANAAPWSWALKEAYLDHFPEDSLFEVYGSTELGVNTILRPEEQRVKKGSCGRPAPGVELALFDEEGERITAPNVPGELFARSKSVFNTYYKAEEKYEKDRRGDFHTVGDVAYFDADGFVFICDRKHDMIISGGMNIYPAEIEAALDRHPDVLDVAVFGIPSEEWGESVHASVVARPGAALDEAVVTAWAREHLAGYKVPRSFAFVDEIPRNGSGKILKRELRAPYWETEERGVH